MITIAGVADKIGEHIGTHAGLQSEVKKICYGVECLLIMFISIVAILVLGWLLGVFKETMFIALAALLMKYIIGGPHLSGFSRCTGFSALIFIGVAWLLKTYGCPHYLWLIVFSVLGSTVIIYHGPHFSQGFRCSKKQIRLRKITGVSFLMLLACINSYLHNLQSTYLMVGALLTVMLGSPIGVSIVQWVERITKGKEVQSV